MKNSIAKKIILEELKEQAHPEKVENVIFWALEHYANSEATPTIGTTIAYCIKQRILEEEAEFDKSKMHKAVTSFKINKSTNDK